MDGGDRVDSYTGLAMKDEIDGCYNGSEKIGRMEMGDRDRECVM